MKQRTTPAIVLMEDVMTHTVDLPECLDEQCICHENEREKRENRQAWREYCSWENQAHQRIRSDCMKCTVCGKETLVAHLNDSGRCDRCCR